MSLRLKPKVIGFYSPQPQMGKSTAVSYLKNWLPDVDIRNVKLSWSLKAPLELLLHLNDDQVAGSDKDLAFSDLELSAATSEILESGKLREEDKQAFIQSFTLKYANHHIAEALVSELEGLIASQSIWMQTPRAIQISFYLNLEQIYGSDWLCKLAQIHIKQLSRKGAIAIIDDVRTEADYEMISALEGSEVWYIERLTPKEGVCGGSLEGRLNHCHFDAKIKANSLEALESQLKSQLTPKQVDTENYWQPQALSAAY